MIIHLHAFEDWGNVKSEFFFGDAKLAIEINQSEIKFHPDEYKFPTKDQIKLIIKFCKIYLKIKDKKLESMNLTLQQQLEKEMERTPPQKIKERKIIPGHIYFLTEKSGKTKIGKTSRLEKRISSLSQTLPIKPILHHSIATNDTYSLELYFHSKYQKYRINGEWFDLPESELNEIKKTKIINY